MAPLRRGPVAARMLGLRVRTPPEEFMFVSCECCVLSGTGLRVQRNTNKRGTFNERDREAPRSHDPESGQSAKGKIYIYIYIRSVLLTQYCAGDKIEKNEMGWACGAYG